MSLRARLPRRLGPWVAAALLAGCNGGIYFGVGDDDWDNEAPSVSIAAASSSVVAGGTLHVVAAAADDDGIEGVDFYRRDGSRWVFISSDIHAPYEAQVPVPDDGRTRIEVYARATDRDGWEGVSDVLQVAVYP